MRWRGNLQVFAVKAVNQVDVFEVDSGPVVGGFVALLMRLRWRLVRPSFVHDVSLTDGKLHVALREQAQIFQRSLCFAGANVEVGSELAQKFSDDLVAAAIRAGGDAQSVRGQARAFRYSVLCKGYGRENQVHHQAAQTE